MLKQKRTWNLIGCILGLVMLIVGLVFLNSPPEAYHTESAEYAAFGADYYTYQYDATKQLLKTWQRRQTTCAKSEQLRLAMPVSFS